MTIKHKYKPAARADIREKVEFKFRARGAVAFHLLLVLIGAGLLLYNWSYLWASRFFQNAYQDSILVFVFLAGSGALHFIRYHYRHGSGRDKHERETEARIRRQLERAAPEAASEQEVLIRIQQDDKLKNRRLVWQHLMLFVGILSLLLLLPLSDRTVGEFLDWPNLRSYATFAGVWGIGLAAHILRYVFAYRVTSGRREAQIEQQLERELRRERRQRLAPVPTASDNLLEDSAASGGAETTIEDLLRGPLPAERASRQRSEAP